MEDMSETYRVTESALMYYSERLRRLLDNPEIIQFTTSPIKDDLLKEIMLVEVLRNQVKEEVFQIQLDIGKVRLLDVEENKRIALDAIGFYNKYLKTLKDMIKKALDFEINFTLEQVKNDIDLCDEIEKNQKFYKDY